MNARSAGGVEPMITTKSVVADRQDVMECARGEKEQDHCTKHANDEPVMPLDGLVYCRHDQVLL
jgi:hypothetical protein